MIRRGVRAPITPHGTLRAGCGRVEITPPVGGSFSGFSIISLRESRTVAEPLWATAMVIDDGETRVAFVALDLLAGTRYLSEHVAAEVTGMGLDLTRVNLVASHTHFGPGGIFGDSVYDKSASSKTGFDAATADFLVARIVSAIEQAVARLTPARIGYGETRLWGYTANRSLDAFRAAPIGSPHHFAARFEGYEAVKTEPWVDAHYAVDPRIRVLWAQADDGTPLGAIATVAAHSAAQDPLRGTLTSGPMGIAARRAMATLQARATTWGTPTGAFVLGVAVSNAGDTNIFDQGVMALPEEPRGVAMARSAWEHAEGQVNAGGPAPMPERLGEVFGEALVEACEDARARLIDAIKVVPICEEFDPSLEPKLAARPTVGRVSLGASEYGRFFLEKLFSHMRRFDVSRGRLVLAKLGRRTEPARMPEGGGLPGCRDVVLELGAVDEEEAIDDYTLVHTVLREGVEDEAPEKIRARDNAAHFPKCRLWGAHAIGFLTGDYPKQLPMRLTRLSETLWIVALPFEITVAMGQAIEALMREDNPAREVMLFSVSGAYASYLTTPEEYDVQCYEGSSTAWGRYQGPWVLKCLQTLRGRSEDQCATDVDVNFRLLQP